MRKIRTFFIFAALMFIIISSLGVSDVFAVTGKTGTASSNAPLIRSFKMTESGNGIYRAEWDISNVTETVYVNIYASQSRSEFEGVLAESIESGTHGSVDIYMPDVDSGYYIFYMSATGTNGVAGYKYAEDYYFYDNLNRPDKLSGIALCKEKNELYAMWDGDSPGKVQLFDPDTGELVLENENVTSPCVISLPKGYKNFIVGTASYAGGIMGRFDPVNTSTLKSSDAVISFPSYDVTVNSEAEIGVKADGVYSLKVYNNGKLTESVEHAPDTYTVALDEGKNDLIAILKDSKNRLTAAESRIESDTIAPELTLVGQTEDVRTADEEITLKGYVDEGSELKYLGEKVDLAGGYFYLSKPLGFGKNQFTLTAYDKAGNTTEKTVTVERIFWSQRNILIILLAISVAAVLIVEMIILFFRSDRKRRTVQSAAPGENGKKKHHKKQQGEYPKRPAAGVQSEPLTEAQREAQTAAQGDTLTAAHKATQGEAQTSAHAAAQAETLTAARTEGWEGDDDETEEE